MKVSLGTLALSSATKPHTNTSLMITTPIRFSIKRKNRKLLTNQSKSYIHDNADAHILLPIYKNRTNNSSRHQKLDIKSKQKKVTYTKYIRQQSASKAKKQKKANNKLLNQSNKNKQQQRTQPKQTQSLIHRKKLHNSKIKRRRNSALTLSSHHQQQKLKATKISKTKSIQNQRQSKMALHQLSNKIEKSRDNTPIRTFEQQQQHLSSSPKSPTTSTPTPTPSPQPRQKSKAKQHIFEKRDRTTSLMALQVLAEKIAIYKEKYGDIETRNSSIVGPPKLNKRQKQQKK